MDPYFPIDAGDEDRRATIAAIFADREPLPLLSRGEEAMIIDAFLRQRELNNAPFTEIEWIGVIQWAQHTRLNGGLLTLLREDLLGIDVEGPEIVFCAPTSAASFDMAAALVDDPGDDDVRRGLLAFAAHRWEDGELTKRDELVRVAQWVRTTRDNVTLLDAFIETVGATIDFDERGRVVIYPPERL